MPELNWVDAPELRRPILVLAFEGFFDASGAATDAALWIADRGRRDLIAEIDPDGFYDFQQTRPQVLRENDGTRSIRWPTNSAVAVRLPGSDHDLIVLAGVEPHVRWRAFCTHLAVLAHQCHAEMVVTLGSMAGMAPHTRPLGVIASSTDAELARRLGLRSPSYEGPTGVIGVLHDILDASGQAVISLRVSVPHYVPGSPNPEATRSLLRRFELVTGVGTDHSQLDEDADEWRSQVDLAVADDPGIAGYIKTLEGEVDQSEDLLPSGDDLATELEAFLRERRPPEAGENDDD